MSVWSEASENGIWGAQEDSHALTWLPITCHSAWNLAIRALFLRVFSVICVMQTHPLGVGRLTSSGQQGRVVAEAG